MSASETVIDQSRKLLGILSSYVEKMPRDKKFTIGDRIIKISLETLEVLVEAYYSERRNKIEKIDKANVKLEILRQIIRHLFETGSHDLKKHEYFNRKIYIAGDWANGRRVLRGGSWNNNQTNMRCANRNRNEPENRNNNVGFRCVRQVEPPESSRGSGRSVHPSLTAQFPVLRGQAEW